MRIDKDGVVHFDTGGGDFSGFGDGSSQGGGYNDGGGDVNFADISEDTDAATTPSTDTRSFDLTANFNPFGAPFGALDAFTDANLSGLNAAVNLANAVAAQEASGLQAGAYSPAVAQAIVDMMSSPPSEDAASGRGFHSPGLSYGTLAGLEKAGYGKTDIPGFGQNIEQALAAQNVHNVLNYTVPALVSMVPGYGTVSALGKGIANIHALIEGRLTPAEVIPGLAAGLIGAKTGIPSGILEGIFEGNLGKAAGAGAQAGLGAIASNFGPFGSLAYNLSGMSSAANKGVSEAVSRATGGGRSEGLGALPGASSAPSSSTTPTGSSSGDLGITQEVSPTRAAIEQAVQQSVTPSLDRQILAGRYGPIKQYEYGA